MATAAAKSVAEMDKIRGALTRQQEAQKAARAAGLEEVAVLQSKIKIQQQVQAGTLSLAQATRRMAEADIFAKTGNRELAQSLAATRAEYDKNARAIQQHADHTQRASAAMSTLRQIVGGLTIAGAFLAAARAAKDLTEEGLRYNATLESQRIGIAALITATQRVTDAQGRRLEDAEKFNAAQVLASGLMKQLERDALQTMATTEQLVTAFQQALGPLSAAGLTLEQARKATTLIVQAAGALKLPMNQVAQEVRAIAEGSIDMNAQLANALGITKKMVDTAREQGKLFELIVEETKAFATAGKATEQSWEGLSSSISDVSSQILGLATAPLFDAMKEGMQGVLDVLLEIRKYMDEDLPAAITRTSRKLFELQQQQLEAAKTRTLDTGIGEVEAGGIRVSDVEIQQLNEALQKLQVEWGMQNSAMQQYTTTIDQELTPAQRKANAAIDEQVKRLKEHAATLNLSDQALAEHARSQALAGGATQKYADQLYKAVLADEAAQRSKEKAADAERKFQADLRKSQAERERIAKQQKKDEEDRVEEVLRANLLVKKLNDEKFRQDQEVAKATVANLAKLQEELIVMQEEGQLIQASLAPKSELRNLELSIAKARIERAAATELASVKEGDLAAQQRAAIVSTKEQALANVDAAASFTTMKESIEDAALTTADLKSVTQGILSGTQSIGDIFEDLGQTAGVRMVEGIMFGKGGKEKEILMNFNQLLGVDAAGIFGAQGMNLGTTLTNSIQSSLSSAGVNLGSLFGSSAVDAASVTWEQAAPDIFAAGGAPMASAQSGGSMLGSIFGSAMAGAAGLSLGKGLSKMMGVGSGKGMSGTLGTVGGIVGGVAGGMIAGPLGAAAGAALGSMWGSFVGSLFTSTPTRGTEIRKGAKKFLKEIEASFASEIDSGDYFFEETKKLAKKMFGGDGGQDFLKASKVILNDKIGPELGKQLQALGTLITAKQAQKLGKDVEQTGTTFGNMLLDNLGLDPEEIQGAIDEIVSKAGISFDVLTDKLSKLFQEGEIGAKFYTDAIEGAVSIFFQDLPDAIGAAKLAMQSFGEDGIFDLEKFTAELEKVTATFDVLVASFVDVVANSEAGEDIGKLLADQIAMGLETLAVNQFLTKFIEDELFKGIDLTNGLDADELALIQTRAGAARGEVEKLWAAFGEVGKEVEATEEKVEDLFEKIRDLTNQRFELRLNVIGDLESIGAISGADAARARIGANSAMVSRFANPNGLGARISDFVSDAELEQAREAVAQTRQATVELFQAQEQAAQDALAKRIRDINTDYDARRKSLAKEAAAAQDASEARLSALAQERDDTQKLFQERIDGLQEELQIAQEFRQVAESIQDTINGLVQSSSRFSGPEQIAIFEQQAAGLRQRLQGTTGAERAAIIGQLSEVLQQQLAAGEETMSQEAFSTMFDSVVKELESLRDEAAVEGDRVEQIQNAIAQTTAQMQISLESIDAQMEAERVAAEAAQDAFAAQAEALSVQETAAITAAQAATDAEIAALRMEAVVEIQKLAVIEDQILAEQLKRAEYEVSLTEQQVTILGNINTGIVNLTTAITGFLDSAILRSDGV